MILISLVVLAIAAYLFVHGYLLTGILLTALAVGAARE